VSEQFRQLDHKEPRQAPASRQPCQTRAGSRSSARRGKLAVPDDAPLVDHLEPIEVAKRLGGLGDRVRRRIGLAIFGHTAELDDLERLLGHGLLLVAWHCAREGMNPNAYRPAL
jgi:hypothetical protein